MSGHVINIDCPSCSTSLSVVREPDNPFFVCSRCSHVFEFVEKGQPIAIDNEYLEIRNDPFPLPTQQPIEIIDPRSTPRRGRWWGCAAACMVLVVMVLMAVAELFDGTERDWGRYTQPVIQDVKVTDNGLHVRIIDANELHQLALTHDHLSSVTSIDLSNSNCGNIHLSLLRNFTRVEKLNLNDNQLITDRGLGIISSKFPALKTLTLNRTGITDEGIRELASIKSLERLEVSGTSITGSGLSHLSSLPNLTSLYAGQTAITNDGLQVFGNLKSLQALSLQDTKIDSRGLIHLENHPSLEMLNLNGTEAKFLGPLSSAPRLRVVHVNERPIYFNQN